MEYGVENIHIDMRVKIPNFGKGVNSNVGKYGERKFSLFNSFTPRTD